MKKILFLAAIAASMGVMTSCSQEDDYMPSSSIDSNSIVFSTSSAKANAKAATRSAVTLNSINKFTVSAVNADKTPFFSSVLFDYNSVAGVFQSTPNYYWPLSGSLSFYAISDPGTVSTDAENVPHYEYQEWNGETDLVAATVLAGEKTIPYPLTFQHVLSQVSVSAEAKDKTEQFTYKLTSVEMETPCDGTYCFANATGGMGTWEIDNASSKEYSFADALPLTFNETGSVTSGSTYWNILPVTNGKIKFKVGYQVFQNGKMIADFSGVNAKTCEVENPNLDSGKRYVYNFQLTRDTNDAITFTTSLVDWDGSTITDIMTADPSLTYVTYTDGSTKSFDISGVIESTEESVYLRPATIIDRVKEAVEIKLGNNITEIGYKAFAGCRNLRKLEIPSSVTKIGKFALSDCRALTDIKFSEGLQEIGEQAFGYQNGYWCGMAASHIELPSTLKKIGKNAFAGSIFITDLYLPDGLEEIGELAFAQCNSLETVSIPANCTIGLNAFRQGDGNRWNDNNLAPKTSLKTAIFRGKVNFDSHYAIFWGCKNLSTIKYYSTELPNFGTLDDEYNAWSSVTSTVSMGCNSREDGTNMFYVPSNATYTEDDLDYMKKVVFNPDYCGFTLSKSL